MQHLIDYELDGKLHHIKSSLVCIGDDQVRTAMAKTVGLPAAIGTKMILNGVIKSKGVQIPTTKEIYEPILQELESFGVSFIEEEKEMELA